MAERQETQETAVEERIQGEKGGWKVRSGKRSNGEGWEKQRGVKGVLMILQMEANEFIQGAV